MDGISSTESPAQKYRPVLATAWRLLLTYWTLLTTIITLVLAIAGQILVQGKENVIAGVLCFLAAIIYFLLTVWGDPPVRLGLYPDPNPRPESPPLARQLEWRLILGIGSGILALMAYRGFAGNFLPGGLIPWLFSILFFLGAVMRRPDWSLRAAIRDMDWRIVTALALITGLAVFFRAYRLVEIPVEMTSDHAEKLLDVFDVLSGQYPIFFVRNTGREMFQFYLTAALIQFTPLEISHLALKVGTAIFGIVAVPVIYFLGRQEYGRVVGLLAAFFLAISHWHVAITRVGLRFPFTPAFAIPALFFLLRAFRYNRRNDWLAAGLVLGVGLHTYTAMRVAPLLFLVLVGLKVVMDAFQAWWRQRRPVIKSIPVESSALSWSFWQNGVFGGVAALLVYLPLLRVMQDIPENFWYRAQSRALSPDSISPAGLLNTFFGNVKNALLMFNYEGDVVPINTVANAPVLGVVSAALFVLGVAFLFWRLLRRPERRDLYLLVAIGMLMLPSILSLAFPDENPSVVRTAGAAPLVMIIVALPLAAIVKRLWAIGGRPVQVFTIGLLVVLLGAATIDNYRWYFIDYHEQALVSLWNATEMGAEVRGFVAAGGSMQQVYHVPYPHWVDTRNIAINAGDITWRNAVLNLEDIPQHAVVPGAKLYLVHVHDNAAENQLDAIYPRGAWRTYRSDRPGKDFRLFYVPME